MLYPFMCLFIKLKIVTITTGIMKTSIGSDLNLITMKTVIATITIQMALQIISLKMGLQ